MQIDREDTAEKLKEFLSDQLSVPLDRLNDDVSFFHDLGVDGDDASDLLVVYAKKFDVNIDDFPINEYFGAELPLTPLHLLERLSGKSKQVKLKRLTVKNLIDGVFEGKLNVTQ
jgi:acyl carrier protein